MANGSNGPLAITPGFFLAILAMLGIGSKVLNSPPPPQPSPASETHAAVELSATSKSNRDSAVALLQNFFDEGPSDARDHSPHDSDASSAASWAESQEHKGYKLSFLVATLPEPSSPPLRYQFDSFLGAIQMGLGRAGYVLDSFNLPWLAQARANAEPLTQTRPGVMLFRRGDPGPALLVVFVVGETPTAGISKPAFRDALDQIASMRGWKRPDSASAVFVRDSLVWQDNSSELRILGPTYSGSAVSMRLSLAEWLRSAFTNKPARVRIVSGTATAITDELTSETAGTSIHFAAMRLPDAALWNRALHDLRVGIGQVTPDDSATADGISGSSGGLRIAVLTDNTSYGGAAAGHNSGVLRMTFPLHISNLRTAFSRADLQASAAQAPMGRHDIPVSDDAGLQEPDTVPVFSSRSVAYDELVLQNEFAAIRDQHIRYVGVVATDVEDLVFLVREIRRNCPDTVVFTTSSDLRFIHSDVNADLLGSLVFSTYPLFPSNQSWTFPFNGLAHPFQFPSEEAEGIFNAVLAQLDTNGDMRASMVEYGVPFVMHGSAASPPEYPVVWVSVVGRNSLWPITFQGPAGKFLANVYPAGLGEKSSFGMPSLELSALYPQSFQIAAVILTIACLLPCIGMLWPKAALAITDSPGTARPWTESLFGEAAFDEFRRERALRIGAFTGALLLTYLAGLGFFVLPLRNALGAHPLASIGSLGVAIGALMLFGLFVALPVMAAAMIKAVQRIAHTQMHRQRGGSLGVARFEIEPTGAQFAFFGTLVGVILVVFYLAGLWSASPIVSLLTFVRGAHLGNGVSPLMPLIFLGISNFCLISGDLVRLRLLEDCRIVAPFLGFDGESFRGVADDEKRVIYLLECSPWKLPWVGYLVVGLLSAFTYFAVSNGRPVASFDGWTFDALFFLSAIFIYTYFSLLLLRFVCVWMALHRLLRRLYWHPTRNVYEKLRTKTLPERPEAQRIRLIEPRPSLTAIEYCLERARDLLRVAAIAPAEATKMSTAESEQHSHTVALVNRIVAQQSTLEADIRRIEARVSRMIGAQIKGKWQDVLKTRSEIHSGMSRLGSLVTGIFEPVWRLSEEPAGQIIDPVDQDAIELAGLFIASRVVDLLRQIFPQLKTLAGFAMGGALSMMLAFSTYPFMRHDTLMWMSWIVLLSVIATGFFVFIQINRCRIVSMLSGTQPGRFNFDSAFVKQMLTFGVIPILTLLGAQFPATFGGVLTWISKLFGAG